MSISGVSPFSPPPTNDPRAEFKRLREAHAKEGPNGHEEDREKKKVGSQPSAAATALADPSAMAANASQGVRRVDFSV